MMYQLVTMVRNMLEQLAGVLRGQAQRTDINSEYRDAVTEARRLAVLLHTSLGNLRRFC
jgi:hypothetical protein